MHKIFEKIFIVIIFANNFLEKKININILRFIHSQYIKHCYISLALFKKKIVFFSPTKEIKSRVETLLTKEPNTIEWIDGFKGKNVVFWDIGSNIGLFSIYASLKHRDINIVSFEPSQNNLRILARNISINSLYKKIAICPLPLTEKEFGFIYFNERQFLEGAALNFTNKRAIRKTSIENNFKTLAFSLNNILLVKNIKVPNYIKIDVDGTEDLIVKGANKILKKPEVKEIIIEINTENKKKCKFIFSRLKKYNFFLFKSYKANLNDKNSKEENFLFKRKNNSILGTKI
jgi:FkbM family methyltransferase